MTKKEIEKLIQQTKAEFLNEEVVKESDLETAQKQSYAKGWNACNNHWIQTLRAQLDEIEDAISREDAIRIASINSMPVNECVRLIKELPSVTPQPKVGKWIEVDICNCHATLKCSVCDRVIEPTFTFGEYSYEDIKEWYPFCHCGADMRGEKE